MQPKFICFRLTTFFFLNTRFQTYVAPTSSGNNAFAHSDDSLCTHHKDAIYHSKDVSCKKTKDPSVRPAENAVPNSAVQFFEPSHADVFFMEPSTYRRWWTFPATLENIFAL